VGATDIGRELAAVADRHPDLPALSDSAGARLSYRDLISAARGLAATLPAVRGPAPKPVALVLPHEAGTVVAMVAALLARRPYCALDPAQPRRRLEELLATLEPELIWTSRAELRSRLRAIGHEAAPPRGTSASAPGGGEQAPAEGDAPCALYVTSGTSGTPKPVRYLHGATLRRARGYAAAIAATPDDVFSLVSPLWVAASASGLFAGLLSGAEVRLMNATARPQALAGEIAGVSVWHSTPSLLRRLASAGVLDAARFRVLRLGGEPLLAGDVERTRAVCAGDPLLVTGYSLTEANGAVTQKAVPLSSPQAAGPDAGKPVDGIAVRIEDAAGNPAPAGEEGEIVLSGDLSGGYADPAEGTGGTRFAGAGENLVLRTGDNGVLRRDGSLEVRGRDDDRMKIRGHRVDPVEIQAAALAHPRVGEAEVVPFTAASGTEAIALFAVPSAHAEPVAEDELRRHLEARLPPAAVPAIVRVRGRLPLTPSGKADRLRLARIASEGDGPSRPGPARVDPVVAHLVRLWEEALETRPVAPDHDFFGLGGDSLAAAEVCAGIESVYGQSMEPATLLRHRTPLALGRHVREALAGTSPAASHLLRLNPAGTRPVLFAIPGAGSEATALVHFAEAMGADQPVGVIQLPGADGRRRPLTDMRRITAHCVDAIRESGAEPPYRLAGTSFGGLVAYAVAAALLESGAEVEYVGLFDTPAPATRRSHLAEPLRRFRVPPGLSARSLARNPGAEMRRLRGPLRNLWVNYRLVLSLRLPSRWQPPAELRFRRLRAACLIAADGWRAPALEIPFHLYRCASQPDRLADLPYLGWEAAAPRVELRSVPATHGGHIRPPGVRHLAAAVADDLGRLRRREPQPA
jgi:acyl-coenzyme A synthetase/AMP-(fatty) acid ligase/thioesterase domain-containing protein